MSHPDPLYDPENSYEDDDMTVEHDPSDALLVEHLYNDYNDFYEDEDEEEEFWDDSYDDSMDGDLESGLSSAGWGTDESYGYYGEDF